MQAIWQHAGMLVDLMKYGFCPFVNVERSFRSAAATFLGD